MTTEKLDLYGGTVMEDGTYAEVLKFKPTAPSDLYIKVTSGRYAGHRGWTSSAYGSGEHGVPINRFANATLQAPQLPTGKYYLRVGIRAFQKFEACGTTDVSLLREEVAKGAYYDFKRGALVHVVSDPQPESPWVVVGDDYGHEGCIARDGLEP